MANDEILMDDYYIAGLLSQEASDCSIKYSALGVDAFLPSTSKKPENIPKPNTRFLRNIIRGTDSHNKALLAREAAESKARLRRLERNEETKRKKTNPSSRDLRERHMGDIQAILDGKARRRRDTDKDAEAKVSLSKDHRRNGAKRKSRHQQTNAEDGESKCSRRYSPSSHGDRSSVHSSRRDGDDSRSSRHRDYSFPDDIQSHKHKRSRNGRSCSPTDLSRRKHGCSKDAERHERHHSSSRRSRSPLLMRKRRNSSPCDPPDELIGPAPPPKIRGRGAVGALSGIDRRFSTSYDPKTDMQGVDDTGP